LSKPKPVPISVSSETAGFTSETETGLANLVKPSPITVSLSKPKKDGGFHLCPEIGFLIISKSLLITGFQHCHELNVSLTKLLISGLNL